MDSALPCGLRAIRIADIVRTLCVAQVAILCPLPRYRSDQGRTSIVHAADVESCRCAFLLGWRAVVRKCWARGDGRGLHTGCGWLAGNQSEQPECGLDAIPRWLKGCHLRGREELIAAGLERAAAGSAGERLEGVRRERMRAAGAIMATTHAKTRASGSMGFCDTRCP